MPNTIQADGGAMPAINRRRMLLGLAAASTAAATAIPATADAATAPTENPTLLGLADELASAQAELAAARNDKEWLLDEWRHLWPLAPDEITWCRVAYSDRREVDLDGKTIIRKDGTGRELQDLEWLESWIKRPFGVDRRGKPITNARRLADLAKIRKEQENAFRLGQEYYAEIERIREASGIGPAKERIMAAEREVESIAAEIMGQRAVTMTGFIIKIEAYEATLTVCSGFRRLMKTLAPCKYADQLVGDLLAFAQGGAA